MHGFDTSVETKSVLSSATGVAVIPPNNNRRAILIGSPPGRTTLLGIGATGNASQGVSLPPNAGPLLLSVDTVGKAVGAAITLTDSGGAQQTFTWTEWTYAA